MGKYGISIHLSIQLGKREKSREKKREKESPFFLAFMAKEKAQLRKEGQINTALNYRTVLRSFRMFLADKDLPLDAITRELIKDYNHWLQKHVKSNTISCYLRTLRAVYNKAVKQGLTRQRLPFEGFFMGNDKVNRSILDGKTLRRLAEASLPTQSLCFARDLLLFCFLACGMPFVDMAFLRKDQIVKGYLTYYRQKTGKRVCLKVTPPMAKIIQTYDVEGSDYVFPILQDPVSIEDAYEQYHRGLNSYNQRLKRLATLLRIEGSLSSYTPRHTWASLAYEADVPVALISQALGHTQARTTQIYLHALTQTLDGVQELVYQKYLA